MILFTWFSWFMKMCISNTYHCFGNMYFNDQFSFLPVWIWFPIPWLFFLAYFFLSNFYLYSSFPHSILSSSSYFSVTIFKLLFLSPLFLSSFSPLSAPHIFISFEVTPWIRILWKPDEKLMLIAQQT